LQQQAIEKARVAFSRLPEGNVISQECIHDQRSVGDIVASVMQRTDIFLRKRRKNAPTTIRGWLDNI